MMSRQSSRACWAAIAWLGVSLVLGCSGNAEPERYGFSGMVTVDGKPAHRMIVQLTCLDADIREQDRYVSSRTDEAGQFIFGDRTDGTSSGFLGAVAGRYAVTFSWMSSDELDAVDQLRGKFTDADRSIFQVTLPLDPNLPKPIYALKTRP